MNHALAALLTASFLCPALASAQENSPSPVPPTRVQDAETAAPVGTSGDAVIDLDGMDGADPNPPLQSREEGLRQGGFSVEEGASPAGGGPLSAEEAASPTGGELLDLPASMDRSSWRMPPGVPAPVEELELWDEQRYERAVADDYEANPLEEPSVIASLEAALSTWDE